MGPWDEVRDQPEPLAAGLGGVLQLWHTPHGLPGDRQSRLYDRVRHFLVRRHKVPSRGTRHYPNEAVFGDLGVLRLRQCCHAGALSCA